MFNDGGFWTNIDRWFDSIYMGTLYIITQIFMYPFISNNI